MGVTVSMGLREGSGEKRKKKKERGKCHKQRYCTNMAAGINDKLIAAVSSYPECERKLISRR